MTSENLNNPWILFESGAIAKGVTSNRVYTLTIDLEPESIKPPLGQFNATKPTCADMWKLVESINNFSDKDALDREKLLRAFNAFWPEFETRFEEIISNTKSEAAPSPRRSTDEMLNEILDIVRGLARDSENTILQKELSFQILHLLQHSKYDRKHSGNPFITNSYYPYGMSDQSYVSSGKINPIFNVIVDHQKLLNRSMNIDKPEQQATEDEGTDKSRMRTDSDDQPENDKKEGE